MWHSFCVANFLQSRIFLCYTANYRNEGLQEELEDGAKKFGQRLAEMKMKLLSVQASDDFEEEVTTTQNMSYTINLKT